MKDFLLKDVYPLVCEIFTWSMNPKSHLLHVQEQQLRLALLFLNRIPKPLSDSNEESKGFENATCPPRFKDRSQFPLLFRSGIRGYGRIGYF